MDNRDKMLIGIGDAIQAYALLEFKLFQLLRMLLDVDPDTAAGVFYCVRNSRDRNKILKQQLILSYGDEYNRFWKSMNGLVHDLDGRRNQIVHGLLVLNEASDPPEHIITRPESYWVEGWPAGEVITHAELASFIEKTHVISELIQHFVWYDTEAGRRRLGLHPVPKTPS